MFYKTILLILFNFFCIAKEEDITITHPYLFNLKLPYITSFTMGQLGNQLYQAAAGISLAVDKKVCYIHKTNSYPEILGKFYNSLPSPIKYAYGKDKNGRDDSSNFSPIKFGKNMEIRGFFASYKYFDHNKDVILKAFSPTDNVLKHIIEKNKKILKEPVKIGLHIRTYYKDFISNAYKSNPVFYTSHFPAPNMHYIKKAIEYFTGDPLFVVCSDNITWAKKALSNINKRFFFSTDSLINDFYLLTLCDHIIISNSTFSWWTAYLNKNKNKTIIAPLPYCFDKKRKIEDTYPSDWVLIKRIEDGKIPCFNSDKIFK